MCISLELWLFWEIIKLFGSLFVIAEGIIYIQLLFNIISNLIKIPYERELINTLLPNDAEQFSSVWIQKIEFRFQHILWGQIEETLKVGIKLLAFFWEKFQVL
jgi:hypothetical protein